MKKNYLIILATIFLLIGWAFGHVRAYSLTEPQSSDLTNGINGVVNGVLKGFAPSGAQNIVNSTQINTPTASGSFSTNDLITPFKAILTLIINLFFVIIQVVIDILKVFLGVISNYKP